MGKRGLGSMDPEKRRLIQSMGGRAVPDHLRSFAADKSLARAAGKAGGVAKARRGRVVVASGVPGFPGALGVTAVNNQQGDET